MANGDGNINLPQVIQQSGSVSQLQEAAQRAGEQQQAAAAAEGQRQQQHERASVLRSQPGDAQNRVRADQKGGQPAPPSSPPGRRGAGPQTPRPQDEEPPAESSGGVLDVVA